MHNLAADPAFAETLNKMRKILDEWMSTTGDMGGISEETMVAEWYPGGMRPKTAIPHFVPNAGGNRNLEISTGGSLKGPALMTIYCTTQGASIVYSTKEGNDPQWQLYTDPVRLKPGKNTIRSVAVRNGYYQSPEQSAVFTIEQAGSTPKYQSPGKELGSFFPVIDIIFPKEFLKFGVFTFNE